jgi:aspartate dehydrogenase
MTLKIGIVGCGTIGSQLAMAIEQRFEDRARLVALCDIDREKAVSLAGKLSEPPPVLPLEELIKKSDLVAEAASASMSGELTRKVLLAKKDVMVMSVGGLVESDIFDLANRMRSHVYVPSGAICGLDGVKSALGGKIFRATLTSRKPPQGFQGAPYVVENKIDLDSIKEETVLFQGNAKEAIRGFPQNVNVAVALSLAGIGLEKTQVKIICSPHFTTNSHEVEVEGEFGRLVTRTDNVPAPQNPKTSYLAVLSAIATLEGILDYSRVGT